MKSSIPKPVLSPYDGYHKYDRAVAEGYDQARETQKHWAEEDRFIQRYFQDRHIRHLLDLPVGTGRFFRHYRCVRSVTGVDVSDEMLAQAAKKLPLLPPGTNVHLKRGDAFSLPFADQTFDAVLTVRLFHLIPGELLRYAIQELCRVGAVVIAQTYAGIETPRHPAAARIPQILSRVRRHFLPTLRDHMGTSIKPAPVTPWSHIQAYIHPQRFIDALFNDCGFGVSETTTIDEYEGSHVNFTIYAAD